MVKSAVEFVVLIARFLSDVASMQYVHGRIVLTDDNGNTRRMWAAWSVMTPEQKASCREFKRYLSKTEQGLGRYVTYSFGPTWLTRKGYTWVKGQKDVQVSEAYARIPAGYAISLTSEASTPVVEPVKVAVPQDVEPEWIEYVR